MLAERVNRISLSPTLRINAQTAQMRAEGHDIVDFGVGEPDFPTPENVKKAAKAALDRNLTKYTANEGILELREAIAQKLKRDNDIDVKPDEVIVCAGAKAALFAAAAALFDEGEEVVIPAPYWVSYPDQARLMKANPVVVATREEDGFKLTPERLKAAITFNTKALILGYPANPTGATYERAELEAIAEICVENGIRIIADEIYEKIVFDGFRPVSIASLNPKVKALTVTVNGFSKAYSMTGWRLGYAAGPKEIIAAMSKVQSHNTSNATSIAQYAALEALRGPQDDLRRMQREFERRRNVIVSRLRAIPGVSCFEPKGTFYVLPHVASFFDRAYRGSLIRNSYGLTYYLLRQAKVAVVPGEAFGAPEHVRLSFATSLDRIEEGMRRIAKALGELERPVTVVSLALNNATTKVRAFAPTEGETPPELVRALEAEAAAHLGYDRTFEWNANLGGIIVQLRTNSPHVADFFVENFFPAELEADIEPHAVLYVVKDVPGREAHAFISAEMRTAFLFNTAYYGQVRALAMALANEISSRMSGTHVVSGACVDFGGAGMLIVAPPGTGRSTHLARLLDGPEARLVAFDGVFVRPGGLASRERGSQPVADVVERKFYVPTELCEHVPRLEGLFDRSKLENVVTSREDCRREYCPQAGACPIDLGRGRCYTASPEARAMLDPYWLGGPSKHVRRTSLRWFVLFRRDPLSPLVARLAPEEALRTFEQGEGGARARGLASLPFYNPLLWSRRSERLDLERVLYERLFRSVACYAVNTASPVSAIQEKLAAIRSGLL